MNIRKAAADEMCAIMNLVDDVFEKEQHIPKELNPIEPSKCPQWWCIEIDGKIVGTAALFKENQTWHIGRIAVSPSLRGQHRGTALLKTMLTDIFAQNIDAVYLDARETTVHMMKKFGAKIIGEPTLFYGETVTPLVLRKDDFNATA